MYVISRLFYLLDNLQTEIILLLLSQFRCLLFTFLAWLLLLDFLLFGTGNGAGPCAYPGPGPSAPADTPGIMQNRSGESGHPCLVFDLWGKVLSFSHWLWCHPCALHECLLLGQGNLLLCLFWWNIVVVVVRPSGWTQVHYNAEPNPILFHFYFETSSH